MRQAAIRGLMRMYRDPSTSEGNRNELKEALRGELASISSESEELISDYLLNDWIDNEMRTELEEDIRKEFGLPEPNLNDRGEIVFRLPNLPKK